MTNFATTEKSLNDGTASLELCYRQGQTHAGYKWARNPRGGWNQQQIEAYHKGFDAVKKGEDLVSLSHLF